LFLGQREGLREHAVALSLSMGACGLVTGKFAVYKSSQFKEIGYGQQ
jgi:hypothetical protein